MPKPLSAAARVLGDDRGEVPTLRPVDRSHLMPARIEPPRQPDPTGEPMEPAPFSRLQNNCYEALSLALKEGQVFAAVTGPARSGKTRVLDAVLADWRDRSLRCIRISEPDKVPARLAAHIEQTAYAEAAKPENLERHIVLAIDDAHLSSDDLLQCLNRLAQMREPGRRVPQVLLVGRPELWTRLGTDEYAPLARRLAIRGTLPAFEEEAADPWASVEQEVSQLRTDGEIVPLRPSGPAAEHPIEPIYESAYARQYEHAYPSAIDPATLAIDEATIPPPSMYALFPDPAPAAPAPDASDSRRRLWLPLGCLAVTVAAFVCVLSLYDWPDMFGDMPWSQATPATPFTVAQPPQAPSRSLPQPPAWSQTASRPAAAISPAPSSPAPSSPAPIAPTLGTPVSRTTAPIQAPPPPADPKPTVPTPAAPETAAPRPLADLPPMHAATPEPPPRPAPEPPKPTIVAAVPPPSAEPAPMPQDAVNSPPQSAVTASAAEPARPSASASQFAAIPTPPLPTPPPTVYTPITATAPLATTPGVAPPMPSLPVRIAPPVAPPAAPVVVTAAPLPPAIISLLLRRGDEQVALGDIFAARLLYERAAEAGSATAALHLARTFDPTVLPTADARILGDRAQARLWYSKAAALGDREAIERIKPPTNGR